MSVGGGVFEAVDKGGLWCRRQVTAPRSPCKTGISGVGAAIARKFAFVNSPRTPPPTHIAYIFNYMAWQNYPAF